MIDAPTIIQGGMGVAISGWRLARAVAARGHVGVVSGTALDTVLVRRLQLGDAGGEVRRALGQFPDGDVVAELLSRYYVPGGMASTKQSAPLPMYTATATDRRQGVAVAAGFVEVFLAKEGHTGSVGINFLEKIQLPTAATLYGALLAGVDYVLVGAGIPRDVPGLLDGLLGHDAVSLPLHVTGATAADEYMLTFDPRRTLSLPSWPPLRRPRFLAIVASATLAASLARRGGRVDGFIV